MNHVSTAPIPDIVFCMACGKPLLLDEATYTATAVRVYASRRYDAEIISID